MMAEALDPETDSADEDAGRRVGLAKRAGLAEMTECIARCREPHVPGQCQVTSDCKPSGPCQEVVRCALGKCLEEGAYRGTPCVQDEKAGLCERGHCVSPSTYRDACATIAARMAEEGWSRAAAAVEICRQRPCSNVERLYANTISPAMTSELLECVGEAVDAGATGEPRPSR